MDNFEFINSGNDYTQNNTQNSSDIERMLVYMNSTDSQPDQLNRNKVLVKQLETIDEEPSNFTSNYKQNDGKYQDERMRINNSSNFAGKGYSIGEKIEYISQEVDQICEETQKISERKIMDSNSNINCLPNSFQQYAGGNSNRLSGTQSVNNSSNLPMKNLSLKGSTTPNSAMTAPNQKVAYLQQNFANTTTTMKTKGKGSLGMNPGYYTDYRTNPVNEQNSNFISQTDRMINNYVLMLEDIKANFCAMVDSQKSKFITNAEVLRDILVFENEYNHLEEEKNQALDGRMECLFKEMMSLLSEFNNYIK